MILLADGARKPSSALRDTTVVIKAQFFKYWLKVGWSRGWCSGVASRMEVEAGGRSNWEWDEKVDREKGRPSIIYDGRGRSLWIFSFRSIINASHFEDKFLIIGTARSLIKQFPRSTKGRRAAARARANERIDESI